MHPISKNFVTIYNRLLAQGVFSFPLKGDSISKIDSSVKTAMGSFAGVEIYSTVERKAAALFYLIIKNHPLLDGNKRMAVILLQLYCDVVGIQLSPSNKLDELAVSIANSSELKTDEVISILEKHLFSSK